MVNKEIGEYMVTEVKDGWHTIKGMDIYFENGKVIRGRAKRYGSFVIVLPYKWSNIYHSYVCVKGEKASTFINAFYNGKREMR